MNARKESLNGVSSIHIKICIRIKSTFVITLLEKKINIPELICSLKECTCVQNGVQLLFLNFSF